MPINIVGCQVELPYEVEKKRFKAVKLLRGEVVPPAHANANAIAVMTSYVRSCIAQFSTLLHRAVLFYEKVVPHIPPTSLFDVPITYDANIIVMLMVAI